MLKLLFIALGGAAGATARYLLATHVHGLWSGPWPLGTLLVNGSGSLLIGVLFALLERGAIHPEWRSVLVVGFLGAFTTFSTFSLETVEIWERGEPLHALGYALTSTVGCVLAAALGVFTMRALLS